MMRLEDSQLVSGSQRGPTVYVDADLPGANRIARFLGDEGWEVVSGPSEIPPMSIPIVFFGPSTDVELWAKLLGSGGLRAIAVGDNADSDVVVGALEVGFDQFVDNSISDRLLLARIRSVARRRPAISRAESGIVLNPGNLSVSLGEQAIRLSSSEFAVLAVLFDRSGSVVSKRVLSEKSGCEGPDSLDSVVRRVRTKLENLEGIRRIRAVRGFGFILDDKV
ncbi:OmpR Response regulators consisting of a CheY-like receiver domain and a winged-helix DNA-binding domain [Acidimicrobiia bacterium]